MGVQPKKNSRLFILLGVILTFASMMGVYFIAQGSSGNKAAAGSTNVVVASRLIPAKTVFSKPADAATWFKTVSVPNGTTPPGAYTSVAQMGSALFAHRTVNPQQILPNQQVLVSMFTGLGNKSGYDSSYSLQKNQVAVSIDATLVNESGGGISPGDFVDLVASYYPSGGGSGATENLKRHPGSTQFVLQDLDVIAVGNWTPGGDSSVAQTGNTMLTFAVDRRTALIIQHLKDFGGSWEMSVMLRSAYNSSQYKTQPVDGTWPFNKLHNDFEH